MFKPLFKTMVAVLAIAAAATGPARAQSNTVTWNNYQLSEFNLSSQGDRETFDDVTITSNGGSVRDNAGSIYLDGAFTFSVPAGSVFTQIVIIDETWLGVEVDNTGWSVDEDQRVATWTGSARSVACQINVPHVQYIEFTIAPAVPKMYTSEVSITELVPGDTLADGATIIGSGDDDDMVYIDAGRTKENGVVQSYWTNLHEPPTVIGTNGTISGTYTPVDGNGRDGNAWVVTSAVLNYYDGFDVGLAGIRIPGPPHTVRFASGNDGWTVTDVDSARSATAPAVLQNVMAGDSLVVTAPASLPGKVKSVKAVKYVPLIVNPVVGQFIGSDGKNYDANATLPTGVTAVAKICYVGSDNGEDAPYNHGLALALSDANGYCKWKTSNTDAGHTNKPGDENFTSESGLQYNAMHNSEIDNYPAYKAAIANNSTAAPTGCSAWFLASGYQWKKMIGAAGFGNLGLPEFALYWSSSEKDDSSAWYFYYMDGVTWDNGFKNDEYTRVRACLAF